MYNVKYEALKRKSDGFLKHNSIPYGLIAMLSVFT